MNAITYTAYRSKLGAGIVRKQTPTAPNAVLLTSKADWGNRSADSLELARLILLDTYGKPGSPELASRFLEDVVSRLPYNGWTLSPTEENQWTAHGLRAAS